MATLQLPKPAQLIVERYDVTAAEFEALCRNLYAGQLDNLPPHEVVFAACAELGLQFQSDRIKKGFITEALNIALRGKPRAQQDKRSTREKQEINTQNAIATLQQELLALDDLDLKADIFLTGVLSGALIMLVLDKDNIAFFQRLNA